MITSNDRRGQCAAALLCTAVLVCVVGLRSAWVSAQSESAAAIRGFSADGSAAEAALEQRFKSMPTASAAEADFDVMTAEPHHAGSPYTGYGVKTIPGVRKQSTRRTMLENLRGPLRWW